MPKENNSSNTGSGVAWYVKPTSDTIDFLKSIPVNELADSENIKIFDNYVKIKNSELNQFRKVKIC